MLFWLVFNSVSIQTSEGDENNNGKSFTKTLRFSLMIKNSFLFTSSAWSNRSSILMEVIISLLLMSNRWATLKDHLIEIISLCSIRSNSQFSCRLKIFFQETEFLIEQKRSIKRRNWRRRRRRRRKAWLVKALDVYIGWQEES